MGSLFLSCMRNHREHASMWRNTVVRITGPLYLLAHIFSAKNQFRVSNVYKQRDGLLTNRNFQIELNSSCSDLDLCVYEITVSSDVVKTITRVKYYVIDTMHGQQLLNDTVLFLIQNLHCFIQYYF